MRGVLLFSVCQRGSRHPKLGPWLQFALELRPISANKLLELQGRGASEGRGPA